MSKSRNLAGLLDKNGHVKKIALGNAGSKSTASTAKQNGSKSCGKNLIINARLGTDTMINQREFSSGTLKNNVYGFDRWKAKDGDAVLTLNASDVTLTSGKIAQIIENPYLSSEKITVSAKVNSGTLTGRIGTVGVFQELPFTVTAPSGNLSLELVGDGSRFTNVKVEKGSIATEFEYRSYGEELALCQQFYWRITGESSGNAVVCMAAHWGGDSYYAVIPFPVAMRTRPTGSASAQNILNLLGSNKQRLGKSVTFNKNQSSTTAAEIGITASGDAASCVWVRFRRKADWMAFSAEL